MKMKKTIALVLATVMMFSLLAGCASTSVTEQQPAQKAESAGPSNNEEKNVDLVFFH